jgi:hypothetical protein
MPLRPQRGPAPQSDGEIDIQIAELQGVRSELARVVERYPAAARHDPTATSKWWETAFAEERR